MGLQDELGFPNAISSIHHEAALGIVHTGQILAKEGDRILRPIGLTDTQFNVLMLLKYQTADGQINQTQLGRMMLVNRSNVTGLVDRMEQAGWVERVDMKGDRRVKMVAITKKGNQVVEKAEKLYFEAVENIFGKLSEAELKRLCRSLERLREPINS